MTLRGDQSSPLLRPHDRTGARVMDVTHIPSVSEISSRYGHNADESQPLRAEQSERFSCVSQFERSVSGPGDATNKERIYAVEQNEWATSILKIEKRNCPEHTKNICISDLNRATLPKQQPEEPIASPMPTTENEYKPEGGQMTKQSEKHKDMELEKSKGGDEIVAIEAAQSNLWRNALSCETSSSAAAHSCIFPEEHSTMVTAAEARGRRINPPISFTSEMKERFTLPVEYPVSYLRSSVSSDRLRRPKKNCCFPIFCLFFKWE